MKDGKYRVRRNKEMKMGYWLSKEKMQKKGGKKKKKWINTGWISEEGRRTRWKCKLVQGSYDWNQPYKKNSIKVFYTHQRSYPLALFPGQSEWIAWYNTKRCLVA